MYKTFAFDDNANEYDNWFDNNQEIYQSELLALKQSVPIDKIGLEIGVGTGRFAVPLGVRIGIEPSKAMSSIARQRGVKVKKGFAENLPFKDKSFDYLLFVTTICFLSDILQSFKEACRVLNEKGEIIIGLINKNSYLGKKYEKIKNTKKFYKNAKFYLVEEVVHFLKLSNFHNFSFYQTLINPGNKEVETPQKGYGKGSFVIIKAIKKLQGSHPEKLSQDEIKRNLTMIAIDKDATWALHVVKDYGLVGEKDEVTPDEALVKCREGLRKIKEAERAHCNQCSPCNHCKPPFASKLK